MSYMILDIVRFVWFFIVIYLSFTFCTTYVYVVYAEFNPDSNFVNYQKAFKYFFWALIRTGNPEFVDIKIPIYTNSSQDESIERQTKYDGNCLQDILQNSTGQNVIPFEIMKTCLYFVNESLSNSYLSNPATQLPDAKQTFQLKYDEGIFLIFGNILWASYQFLLVIVLLSILRAKMISTYQAIIQEADVTWKFYR